MNKIVDGAVSGLLMKFWIDILFYILQADENLNSELEGDVKEECSKLGEVESVKVNIMLWWNVPSLS